jgi:hypothetical protein
MPMTYRGQKWATPRTFSLQSFVIFLPHIYCGDKFSSDVFQLTHGVDPSVALAWRFADADSSNVAARANTDNYFCYHGTCGEERGAQPLRQGLNAD